MGATKKTSVDLLVFNSSMIKGINILKAAHAILLTSYLMGRFGSYLSSIYSLDAGLAFHFMGEISWEQKEDECGPLSI